MQQNILLINTINPTNFGGMSPLVKSPSENNGFILGITDSMQDLSVIDKKSPMEEVNIFNKFNTLGKETDLHNSQISERKRATCIDQRREKDIEVKILESTSPIVGVWSTAYVKLLDTADNPLSSDLVSICMESGEKENRSNGKTNEPCEVTEHDGALDVKFLPLKIGPCPFVVKPTEGNFNRAEFTVEVFGNNPEMSFSESGTDWPVTVAFKTTEKCVYLAFNHHVSKFTQDGEFVKVVVRDKDTFINDLAVDPTRARLVLGVSGWKNARGYKFRFQEVRLYSMNGTHMWTVGKNQPLLFGAPILHVTFNNEGNIIVAGHKCVDVCNKVTGNIEEKFKLDQLTTPSRVCCTPDNGCAIVDAADGTIQVYNECWKLQYKIPIVGLDGESVRGVSGLAVDSHGNILVSSVKKRNFFSTTKQENWSPLLKVTGTVQNGHWTSLLPTTVICSLLTMAMLVLKSTNICRMKLLTILTVDLYLFQL